MRIFLPSILVIAAIGLFVVYTNPTYQATKALQAQASQYDDALTKSQQLRAIRDQLLSKRNTFSADDVQKLQEVLPDNVDNIRFIIDVNNIAARHNISLSNVQLGTIGGSSQTQQGVAAAAQGSAVGSVDIGFSINASYSDMLAFLQDLEHSVRLIDVEKLSFTAPSSGATTDYTFIVRTYWLR
jgi:Tfp pilus assembly protein PilO